MNYLSAVVSQHRVASSKNSNLTQIFQVQIPRPFPSKQKVKSKQLILKIVHGGENQKRSKFEKLKVYGNELYYHNFCPFF